MSGLVRGLGMDCGDSGCRYAVNRGGMRTNGGCRCDLCPSCDSHVRLRGHRPWCNWHARVRHIEELERLHEQRVEE